MSELLSMADICELTGLAKTTIKSHRRQPIPGRASKHPFPEPAHRFGSTPVWRREDVEAWLVARHEARKGTTNRGTVSEWYCNDCRKWNGRSICTACLRINPADARWMTEREIQNLREWAMGGRRRRS